MVNADVIIVGAGPAGSTAAKQVAESGKASCILLDKASFPRDKVCAGGLLFHSFQKFPYIKEFIENYNYSVTVFAPRLDVKFSTTSSNPILGMTRGRRDFDANLLQIARKAGVEFYDKARVIKVNVGEDNVTAECEDGRTFAGKVIIGADSVNSIVAKGAGIFARKAMDEMGIAMEQEFPLGEQVEKYFGKDRTIYLFLHYGHLPGYGWIFPRAKSINIGIGTSTNHGSRLRGILSQLIADLKIKGILPDSIELTRPKVGLIPSTLPAEAGYGSRTLLAGDAASFCSPITGEGIYYAMASGAIAGKVATGAIVEGDYRTRYLSGYNREWKATVGKELEFQYFGKRTVLTSERRCGKAVEWGSQDKKLRDLFMKFFLASVDLTGLKRRMLLQYARCKVKETLGRLKTTYTREEFGK